MNRFRELLRKHWGYEAFRPLQEEIIRSVYEGHDTLGLMPTGGGKSITFQVPALAMQGVCLVITPLIALMKDQVDRLHKIGLSATWLHAGLSREIIEQRLAQCVAGHMKFLYVSPERLLSPLFRAYLSQIRLCLIVVDEAHCLSQWGYDFRPAYLRVAEIRPSFPDVSLLALTATATPNVIKDIQEKLNFRQSHLFQQSFMRPNLRYRVLHTDDKRHVLLRLLRQTAGTTIVYTRNRQRTEQIARMLQAEGLPADYFHAGLPWSEKAHRQAVWTKENNRIIVATNAFGMGIDKADVRLVVHLDPPGSLEEYFQEVGRAGRDGLPAEVIALYSEIDKSRLQRQLTDHFPPKSFIRNVYAHLGEYLRLAIGEGEDQTFDFSFHLFCETYDLSPSPTFHALKCLMRCGYLEFEETDAHEPEQSPFQPVRDKLPISICLNRPLLARRHIQIPRLLYEKRQQQLSRQQKAIIGYMEETHVCRSRLLLDYFGEKHACACGQCDNCLREPEDTLSSTEFETISEVLQEKLAAKPLSVYTLLDQLPFDRQKCLTVIRFLANEDPRFHLEEGFLTFQ